jgi:hypothetical protein
VSGLLSRRGARTTGVSLAVLCAALVALFAWLNAARSLPDPLAGTRGSPEAVAEAVLEAMAAGDTACLRALALTEEEFRGHVWPHLPVSRPEVNMPFDVMWGMLAQTSHGYLRQTLAAVDGDRLVLRSLRFAGASSTYGQVRVHRDAELVVAGRDGDERIVRVFGALVEQEGRWKVFSYVADD